MAVLSWCLHRVCWLHIWKDIFSFRFSDFKINKMINKHGLFKKHLPPRGWEAILSGAGQISLDMKKICFRRCRELVCYLCPLFSAWLKTTNHRYSSVGRLLWEQATVMESTRSTGWAALSRFVIPLPACVQHRGLPLFWAVTCQCEQTSLSALKWGGAHPVLCFQNHPVVFTWDFPAWPSSRSSRTLYPTMYNSSPLDI